MRECCNIYVFFSPYSSSKNFLYMFLLCFFLFLCKYIAALKVCFSIIPSLTAPKILFNEILYRKTLINCIISFISAPKATKIYCETFLCKVPKSIPLLSFTLYGENYVLPTAITLDNGHFQY